MLKWAQQERGPAIRGLALSLRDGLSTQENEKRMTPQLELQNQISFLTRRWSTPATLTTSGWFWRAVHFVVNARAKQRKPPRAVRSPCSSLFIHVHSTGSQPRCHTDTAHEHAGNTHGRTRTKPIGLCQPEGIADSIANCGLACIIQTAWYNELHTKW